MRKRHAILLFGTGLATMFFAWHAGEGPSKRGQAEKKQMGSSPPAVENAAGPSPEQSRGPALGQSGGTPRRDMKGQTAPEGAAVAGAGLPYAGAAAAAEMDRALQTIEQASISYDPAQLPAIRPYLYHPAKEVREAALQGIVNLGDASGARLLRDAANIAASTEEKLELLKMAEYLELPPAPKGFNQVKGAKR
jgi:hypothetical protein